MAFELSFENIWPGGDEFDIVLKDIGYAFDADQHPHLNLLVIERDPERRILTGDLDALGSYPKGVYVLIKTEPDSNNKRRVFVGMAGSDKRIFDIYGGGTDIYWASRGDGHLLTLSQCLEEQNMKCPLLMRDWDLAVIIPEDKDPLSLFGALFSIFKDSEGFISLKTLNRRISYDLFRMHSDAHYILANFGVSRFIYFFEYFDEASYIFRYIHLFMLVCSIAMKLRKKIRKFENEEFDKGQNIEIFVKGKNNVVIVNQTENSENKTQTVRVRGKNNKVIFNNRHYLKNISVGYLDAYFPKQVGPNILSNDFDEQSES